LIWGSAALEETTYGIMFDAGSSSTKAYLYQWQRNHTATLYKQNTFKAVIDNVTKEAVAHTEQKSVWSMPAEMIAGFLDPFIQHLKKFIPRESVYSTLVFFETTDNSARVRSLIPVANRALNKTGMRYLQRSNTLTKSLREGTDGWVTLNYLNRALATKSAATLGALDLGASSAQITFQVTETPRSGAISVNFTGSENWSLYTHSYQQYGLDEMKLKLMDYVRKVTQKDPTGALAAKNPCWLAGYNYTRIYPDNYVLKINGTGDWTTCTEYVKKILNLSDCGDVHCGPGMVYQPNTNQHFIAFGGYYYTFNFFKYKGNTNPSLDEFLEKVKTYCKLDFDGVTKKYQHDKPEYLAQYCYQGIYQYNLLKLGFGLGDKQVNVTEKMSDVIVGWAPGAMMYEAITTQQDFAYCSDYADCSACLYNPNCGFCESTQTCQPGGKTSLATCPEGWQKREFYGYCRSADTPVKVIIAIVFAAALVELVLIVGFCIVYKRYKARRAASAPQTYMPVLSMEH